MKKKCLSIALLAVLLLGLTACATNGLPYLYDPFNQELVEIDRDS